MRVTVVGGGPGGLYFAILMKRADPRHEIRVIERNAPDATFGWGVVFSEETLGGLRDADPLSYEEITETFARWGAIDIHYRGRTIRSRGHVFSGIARKRLLEILQRRCRDLGVDLAFHEEVSQLEALPESDLLVGADGVNSTVRRGYEDAFVPTMDVHSTKFAWFGTERAFDAFTFSFRENEHGLFQVHAYPFDARSSTFIVECPEETWRRAGLDQATEQESMTFCESLFAEELGGRPLMSNRSVWMSFVTLRCESWHRGNVVLLGDAAHTAHFTIGSGTKLAMDDAVSLANAFSRHADPRAAIVEYELDRQPVVERFQEAARESATYFESVRRYADFEPIQFAFNLLTRSGRITHLELERRDARFVASVDGWFAMRATEQGGPGRAVEAAPSVVAPAPFLVPLRLRGAGIANRVVLSPVPGDDALDGTLGGAGARGLLDAAAAGAGLVRADAVAVSAHARITLGSAGLYHDDHVRAWADVAEGIHRTSAALLGACLTHAGRRGATRPRAEGVDRPLDESDGAWPLLAPSATPYTRRSQTPHPMTAEEMRDVAEDFRSSAERALEAGVDVLEVDMGQGYLLASFLSPLTNLREDEYGGSPEGRMRYPLEVFDAVRQAWPADRPLLVRLNVTDWASGGLEVDDALEVARALRDQGCDAVNVAAGQTIANDRPRYGRMFLVGHSDRIRNEAGIPTLVGGSLTTRDEVNTVLAAGRADLCVLDIRRNAR
ncbi:MAG: FAD-dependent monooxygenase [Actinobacteria bacterium]|nr:FAD-dependent monooxygenase [Actinomycetota bacterium]